MAKDQDSEPTVLIVEDDDEMANLGRGTGDGYVLTA
jgi:hypothetical protein